VRQQYKKADIAAYWAFAQQYSLCDNYFTDVASQSEPNHLFLIAANSPVIDNSTNRRNYQPHPPYDIPSLPATLEAAGRTWRNYADAHESYFTHIAALQNHKWNVPSSRFDTDVAAGHLPDVAWLHAPNGLSEHPGDWTGGPVVENPECSGRSIAFTPWRRVHCGRIPRFSLLGMIGADGTITSFHLLPAVGWAAATPGTGTLSSVTAPAFPVSH
jgi:hypothetical protein